MSAHSVVTSPDRETSAFKLFHMIWSISYPGARFSNKILNERRANKWTPTSCLSCKSLIRRSVSAEALLDEKHSKHDWIFNRRRFEHECCATEIMAWLGLASPLERKTENEWCNAISTTVRKVLRNHSAHSAHYRIDTSVFYWSGGGSISMKPSWNRQFKTTRQHLLGPGVFAVVKKDIELLWR